MGETQREQLEALKELRRMRWERETERSRRRALPIRRQASEGFAYVRRHVLRISKAKCARVCAVSRHTVARWENPQEKALPDAGHIGMLADEYGYEILGHYRQLAGLEGGPHDQSARR